MTCLVQWVCRDCGMIQTLPGSQVDCAGTVCRHCGHAFEPANVLGIELEFDNGQGVTRQSYWPDEPLPYRARA